ncbi:7298_t:CDS:2 [Paraglomus occultum]|uniref:7298_t:CDS:1 n=1 Tax=Paraglomus occultum TaxID=144539 RepID=A0A9N8ZT34_9GLOM|nr:7298_t:CDS:2 [Paraglomus occultum]
MSCVFCANSHHPALTDNQVGILKSVGTINLDPQNSSVTIQNGGSFTTLPHVRQIKNTGNQVFQAGILTDYKLACNPSPAEMSSGLTYIALIQRGGCSFSTKIQNALDANFTGAIIYDNDNDKSSFNSDVNSPAFIIDIPAYFVDTSEGMDLLNDLAKTTATNVVYIEMTNAGLSSTSSTSSTSSMDQKRHASVLFFVLFVFAIATMYLCFRMRRNRDRHRSPHGVIPLPLVQILSHPNSGIDENTLAKLKTCPFNEKSLADESLQNQTCVICLEDFEGKDMIRELPCGHIYHVQCIDPWLLQTSTVCPTCKHDCSESTAEPATNSVNDCSTSDQNSTVTNTQNDDPINVSNASASNLADDSSLTPPPVAHKSQDKGCHHILAIMINMLFRCNVLYGLNLKIGIWNME